MKNYYLLIMRKHDETAVIAKTELECIEGLLSRYLSNSYIGCNYFILIDALRKNDGMKEKINNLET